ncbi:MAG: TRAP transporter substrate-binding protein, partial [Pseudomonadota bacterium]
MFSFKKAALTAAVALFAASLTHSAQAAEWRGWNIHKPGYPNTVAMDKFAEL